MDFTGCNNATAKQILKNQFEAIMAQVQRKTLTVDDASKMINTRFRAFKELCALPPPEQHQKTGGCGRKTMPRRRAQRKTAVAAPTTAPRRGRTLSPNEQRPLRGAQTR
jgi:hypothetical protein